MSRASWLRLCLAVTCGVLIAAVSGGVSDARDRGPLRAGSASLPASQSGAITIVTSLRSSLRGPFTMRGASVDSGTARARRTVARKRVQLRVTLAGTKGTITVRVAQACGSTTSTWTALAGSRAYQGVTGGGRGKGRIPCGPITGSIRSILTGSLVVPPPPPPPPAQPGGYGGSRHGRSSAIAPRRLSGKG